MPHPRKVTDEGVLEIQSAARARMEIPTDKELTAKHHISRRRLHQIMSEVRAKLHKCVRSTGNISEVELESAVLEVHSKTFAGDLK